MAYNKTGKKTYNKKPKKVKRMNKKLAKAKGALVKIDSNQSIIVQSFQKSVFPKKMFLELQTEIAGYIAVGAPAQGFADIKMNSVYLPWYATPGNTWSVSANGFYLGPSEPQTLAGLEIQYFDEIMGIYKRWIVHSMTMSAEVDPQNYLDNLQIALVGVNTSNITTNDTVGEIAKLPYSKSKCVTNDNINGNILTLTCKPRRYLGLKKSEYSAGKVPTTQNETYGELSGSASNDPQVQLKVRFAYQKNDNAVVIAPINFRVKLKYFVEFSRLQYDSLLVS